GRRGAAGLGLDTALQLRPPGRRRVDSQRNGKGRLLLGFPRPGPARKDGYERKIDRQATLRADGRSRPSARLSQGRAKKAGAVFYGGSGRQVPADGTDR